MRVFFLYKNPSDCNVSMLQFKLLYNYNAKPLIFDIFIRNL